MSRKGSASLTGELISFEPIRRTSRLSKRDVDLELKFAEEEGAVYTDKGPKFGKRHIEVLSFFLMLFINQCMRQHLSLTIVAMTDPTANKNKDIPTFDWTNKNVILSSFFWGYIAPQIFTGWIITHYGPKWFLIGSTFFTALIGFLIPWLAINYGSTSIIVCRVIQGVSQAFVVPSLACFLSRWVPISERCRSGAFVIAGNAVATVVSMIVSGPLAASKYGWPMIFYSFGFFGIIWCIFYAIFGYNSPSEHKSITEEERDFVIKTTVSSTVETPKTPYGKILLSVPFWALMYSYTCFILISWILLTQIPSYMSKVMKFDIKSNGLLTSLIYFTQWIISMITSSISDYLTNNNYLSTTSARKVLVAIGMVIPSIALIFLSQCTMEDSTKGVILLMAAVGAGGANMCSLCINCLDMAPNHAGVLQGFVNGFSHIFAVFAPLLVDFMVYDENSPDQWKKVFYLASAVAFSGALIFGILGSAEEQSWNEIDEEEDAHR